jgi:hypothetical protein
VSSFLAHELIQEDPRNNSARNQRWFAVHRGREKKDDYDDDPIISLELDRLEAGHSIHTGAALGPFDHGSPRRYFIGLLKEGIGSQIVQLLSARIDLLEMIRGDACL